MAGVEFIEENGAARACGCARRLAVRETKTVSKMSEKAEEHAKGPGGGDRYSYEAGWIAFERNQQLEYAIQKVKGEEKQLSFRLGYFAAQAEDSRKDKS